MTFGAFFHQVWGKCFFVADWIQRIILIERINNFLSIWFSLKSKLSVKLLQLFSWSQVHDFFKSISFMHSVRWSIQNRILFHCFTDALVLCVLEAHSLIISKTRIKFITAFSTVETGYCVQLCHVIRRINSFVYRWSM